jgi:hypothetical protein
MFSFRSFERKKFSFGIHLSCENVERRFLYAMVYFTTKQSEAAAQNAVYKDRPFSLPHRYPSRQEFGKTRLNPTVWNRDCNPVTLKKIQKPPFFAFFAFNFYFWRVKTVKNSKNERQNVLLFWNLKSMRFNAHFLNFSPSSRYKSEI